MAIDFYFFMSSELTVIDLTFL